MKPTRVPLRPALVTSQGRWAAPDDNKGSAQLPASYIHKDQQRGFSLYIFTILV